MDVQEIVTVALEVIGAASVIAAVTPTPKDDGILAIIRKALDMLAANWGNAKNEEK